ncbi:hypothetical protein QBC36DRAFT_24307 [Triangularia setosa]|uniref:Uncharacterized protein n=1 Tax=Triangularia setosa TaxID=2587417 RepID=A0AAN6W5R1_9PEZI|nr:hypothetical protein QBC36DRAFT_24307 [Podospora setosa]
MRPHVSLLALFLGSLSLAQAAVFDRDGRVARRQNAPSAAPNLADGFMSIYDRIVARQEQVTVTETERQTITVGADGAAGAVGNATETVTVTETVGADGVAAVTVTAPPVTVTVCNGQVQEGGEAAQPSEGDVPPPVDGAEATVTAPEGAVGAIETGAEAGPATTPTPATDGLASGGVGVVVVEVPTEARVTSAVETAPPATPTTEEAPPAVADPVVTDAPAAGGDATDTFLPLPTEGGSELVPPPGLSTDSPSAEPTVDPVPGVVLSESTTTTEGGAEATLAPLPGLDNSAGDAASSLAPLPGLESSSVEALPVETPTSTEEEAPAETTAAESAPATEETAAPTTTTPPPAAAASSLDSTLSLANPTTVPLIPEGAFGGVASLIPIASAEAPPPAAVTTPAVANGAAEGASNGAAPNGGGGRIVSIDLGGLKLESQLDLGGLVQATAAAAAI